jgi:hypothetical protein
VSEFYLPFSFAKLKVTISLAHYFFYKKTVVFDINIENVDNKIDWTIQYFFKYQIAVSCFTYAPMLLFFIYFNPEPIVKEELKPKEQTEPNQVIIFEKGEEKLLQIKDNNERIELALHLNQLYFFKASDNYIEVFYTNEQNTEGPSRLVFRNTLKDVENQFLSIPQLSRCHKAYIINTDKVKEVSGNTKGYYLL